MRLVIERLMPSDAPEAELRRAADALEAYADALEAHPRLRYVHGYAESANAGDVSAFFDRSPMIGLANPLAPPITIAKTGERTAEGERDVRLGLRGPARPRARRLRRRGVRRGARLRAVALGPARHDRHADRALPQARRRSTPSCASRAEYVRSEGRKLYTEARVHAGDVLCAEAEGIFVSIARERFEELERERAAREADRAR